MRLLFLYGPPGVGKLSVASELVALTGFKLFHNHLSVDLVTTVFPRESEAWGRLLRRIRQEVFAEVTREGVDLVFTNALRGSDQAAAVHTLLQPARAGGGTVLFVQLTCARDELLLRVQCESRKTRGKLTDPQVVANRYDLSAALPFEPHLRIDTPHTAPTEVAVQIATHYSLPSRPTPEL